MEIINILYIKNNKGPRMDPWGIPHVIGWKLDKVPFTYVHCLRTVKYELDH